MLSSYQIEKLIGKGSYGFVYKVSNKKTKSVYAMKKIKLTNITHYERVNIVNELRILATHKCPFIVRFKCSFVDNMHIYLITEFAEMGDLANIIKKTKFSKAIIQESKVWTYFLQISIALSYLHELKIIHRDMKPANVFIDGNDNVKLGDFGVVKIMRAYMMYGQTQIGTPIYMCPEIYKRERYDTKVDIWALGCILYEMMHLKEAFSAINMIELKKNIFKGIVYKSNTRFYSVELNDILNKLICVSPRQRHCIKSILSNKAVLEQLKIRKLEFLENVNVETSFYINCVIPKTIHEWHNLVYVFSTLNSTIKLNSEEKIQMDNINMAKNNLEYKSKQTFLLNDINTRIIKLNDEIMFAKKIIENCNLEIKKLEERKKIMEHILNKGEPEPPNTVRPIYSRPIKQSNV